MTTPVPMPAGACDCHMHIYDDGYPLAPTATFKPSHAPVSAYRQVRQALGLERVVLVQPTGYGLDNRCLLDALPQFGASARGIATVPTDVSDAELARLHAAGVRGVRFMMIAGAGGPLPWDALPTLAARIAPLGWTINLQLDGRELPLHRNVIDRVPGKLVIDHTGKFMVPVTTDDVAFKTLLAILDKDERWVKLSAPYETSKAGPPHYGDVAVLARALVAAHPDRCLWASNWPHPNRVPPPSDAALLALLGEWTGGDADTRDRILAGNAARAYGF